MGDTKVTMGVTGTPCRYVERVSEGLRQRLRQAELLLAKGAAMGQKRREALAEQGTLEPQLDRLLEKTKELQKLVRGGLDPPRAPLGPPHPLTPSFVVQIEEDISKRYGGRPVNLMGVSL